MTRELRLGAALALIPLSAAGGAQAQEVFLHCQSDIYRIDLGSREAGEFDRSSRQFVSFCEHWASSSDTCTVQVDVRPGAIVIVRRIVRPDSQGMFSYTISRETGDRTLYVETTQDGGFSNLQALGRCERVEDPRNQTLAF